MKQILILLASETERMALADILNTRCQSTLCSSLAEAERSLQQEYDALVLDLFLPGTDGLTFLRENHSRCPAVILMMTQLLSADILKEAETAGVHALIRRPCRMDTVAACLIRLLGKRTPPASPGGV